MYNTLDIGLFKNIQYIMWELLRYHRGNYIQKGKTSKNNILLIPKVRFI